MRILVTGAAGFIGMFVSRRLLERGDEVIGLDNLNEYYDVNLKKHRLAQLQKMAGFTFAKLDLADRSGMEQLFEKHRFSALFISPLRPEWYSLVIPHAYIDSNLVGTFHLFEGCRAAGVEHVVYASTSSVYGANTRMPFSAHSPADHPISLYAATKKANEMMAHSYSMLHRLPTTGLRFFTVYGPYGRPDMALFQFTRNMLAGKPIDVFNLGAHRRDFTYVDDIAEGVVRALDQVAAPDSSWDSNDPDPARSAAPFRLYNIGNSQPVELLRYIEVLENCLGRKAERNLLPMQPGDVPDTYADVNDLVSEVGYRPSTPVEVGVARFVDWYLEYYGIVLDRRS